MTELARKAQRRVLRPPRWLLLLIGVVAALALFANVNFSNLVGSGRVLDWKTHEPIADVDLTADCARSRLVEGSRTIKTIKARSGPDGEYYFSFLDTWHCNEFYLDAEKTGYVRLSNAEIPNIVAQLDYGSVASVTWMVRDKDVVPLRIEGLFAESAGTMYEGDGSGRRAYFEEFTWTLQRFTQAMRTATTDEQRVWIEQRFCPLLLRKFAAIPPADRPRLVSEASGLDKYSVDWQADCKEAVSR